MEFKKCARCGNFFVTEGDVCQNCIPKDNLDIFKLNNYLNAHSNDSVDNISIGTGISTKNVSRYLNNNNFSK